MKYSAFLCALTALILNHNGVVAPPVLPTSTEVDISSLLSTTEAVISSTEADNYCRITGSIPDGGFKVWRVKQINPVPIYFDTCASQFGDTYTNFDTDLYIYRATDLSLVKYNDVEDDSFPCATYSIFDDGWASHLEVPYDGYDGDYYLVMQPWLRVMPGGDYVMYYPCDDVIINATDAPWDCVWENAVQYLNWDAMVNLGTNIPSSNLDMSFDESQLQLTFDIDLQFVATATSAISQHDLLGSTYVIDFYSFGTSGHLINEPGSCQNRLASTFDGITDFADYWTFSLNADHPGGVGTNATMAYPPTSDYWTLTAEGCTPINYYGVFSWSDLISCTDYDGNQLITVTDGAESIILDGTLYVTLVSPYSMGSTDTGFYRTLPIIQQGFSIEIKKQINVLSSTGVELFITTIIGIAENESDGSFELSVLTQSADFIALTGETVISTPLGPGTISEVTSSCLVASSFTCAQIFTIVIPASSIQCPPADFSGDYELLFTVDCRADESVEVDICTTFIDDNDGSLVALEVTSSFFDASCEPELYTVVFDGSMTFHDDFGLFFGDYVIGQDMISVEILANFPDDGSGDNYDIFGVIIDNVFVCTADDTVDLSIDLDQQSGTGGCLSSQIDPDGPYNIITNGVENPVYSAAILTAQDGRDNMVAFQFLAFDTPRTTIYVHAQLTLVLQGGARRRLQVVSGNIGEGGDSNGTPKTTDSDGDSKQIRHFIGSTGITSAPPTTTTEAEIDSANSKLTIVSIIGALIFFIFF